MGRLKHIRAEGCVYSITSCIELKKKMLLDPRLAQEVMDSIIFARKKCWYYLIAFVIMPDHFHLEIIPRKLFVPEMMRSLKGYTSKKINTIIGTTGKIWQNGYHDYAMDDIEAIMIRKNYIEMNPVRANLVKEPTDYPFSSAGKDDLFDLARLFEPWDTKPENQGRNLS